MYIQYFFPLTAALSLWQIPMLSCPPRLIMTEPCHLGTFEKKSMDPWAFVVSFTYLPTRAPWDESHACMGAEPRLHPWQGEPPAGNHLRSPETRCDGRYRLSVSVYVSISRQTGR